MFAVLVSMLVGLRSLACDANIAADGRAADKIINIQSVQVIKESLRRNNDDYKDETWNANLLDAPERSPASLAATATADRNRRAYDAVEVPSENNENNKMLNEITQEQGASRYPNYVDKSTAATLGDYQGANSLPEEFAGGELVAESRRGPAAGAGAPRMRAAGPMSRRPRRRPAGAAAPGRLPSGLQLDMSPARGAKVQEMRSKNRLCQRHVVVPEGPKYDSKGKVYLRAHRPRRGRGYSATRAPHLLLPKCCNCCKKSVLGCE